MNSAGAAFFVLQSVNPIAGILVSIPVAILELEWHPVVVAGAAIPLCYVQVLAVDALWNRLCRWEAWNRFLARKRSARIDRLVASRGAFASTALLAPLVGPWVVMSFMRYAGVSQRAVALPIVLGISWMTALVTATCYFAPRLLDDFRTAAPIVGGALVAALLAVALVPRLLRRR
ncbi:MAG: hypothetical protein HY908_14675 [Myxococcales bacterium]|nr:hypothetical protein [Myxococcales bacterium]